MVKIYHAKTLCLLENLRNNGKNEMICACGFVTSRFDKIEAHFEWAYSFDCLKDHWFNNLWIKGAG